MPSPAAVLAIAVEANTTQANAALAKTQAQLSGTAAKANAAAATMKKALLGVGVVAVGAGVALYKIGEAFDDASDTIRTKTGATGKELHKLQGSFKNVVSSVPADFGDAADAIGEVHQRLEVSGQPLQRLSKQFLELSRITKTDVTDNITTVSKAFRDWDVKTKDQSKTLDAFFRLSQKSGMAVSDIASSVQKFGSPLRQLGFTLDQSAAMFANFERSGVNIQTMVPGLKLAISNLTRPTETLGASMEKMGIKVGNPEKALRQVFDLMSDKSISQVDRTGLAMDVFGKRAGADMAEAIKQGRFEVDDLLKTMSDGDGTIRKAGKQTMDFAEQWTLFKNNVMVALEPLASKVFGTIGDQMQRITDIVSDKKLSGQEKFHAILEVVRDNFQKALDKAAEYGPKIAGALLRGIAQAWWDSDILGKLFLTGAFIRIIGGKGALFKVGAAIGSRIGGTMASTTVAEGSTIPTKMSKTSGWSKAGTLLGTRLGAAVAAAAVPLLLIAYNRQITDFFHKKGFTLPTESVPGKSPVNADTSPGGLLKGIGIDLGGGGSDPVQSALETLQKVAKRSIKQYGSLTAAAQHWDDATRSAWSDAAQVLTDNSIGTRKQQQLLAQTIHGTSLKSSKDVHAFAKALGVDYQDVRRWLGDTANKHKASNKDIQKVAEQTKNKVSSDVDKQAQNVSNSYRNMASAAGTGMETLRDNTNRALKALGLDKAVQFRTNEAPLGKGGVGHRAGKQRGGSIGGTGTGDKVPAMLEPGEFVVNRKATAKHRGLLEKINFRDAPRFATGGLAGVQPAAASMAQKFVSSFGGSISSGLRPGDPGFHGRGLAFDWVGGNWDAATRYANQIGSQLLEGIHQGPPGSNVSWDSGHQVSPSFWGASTWADHISHIHIAVSNAVKGALGSVAEQLPRVLLHGPAGPLTDIGQKSLDKVRNAANAYLAKQMPKTSFDTSAVSGGGTLSPAQFLGVANDAIGVTRSPAFTGSGLLTLAQQESGLRINPPPPHDVNWPNNPSMGLMQITGSNFRAYHQAGTPNDIVDPLANIAASINYQKARYGHQVTFSPYKLGGMVMPPYGGSFSGGGEVPGPKGAPRTIVAHGGETVTAPDGVMHRARDLIKEIWGAAAPYFPKAPRMPKIQLSGLPWGGAFIGTVMGHHGHGPGHRVLYPRYVQRWLLGEPTKTDLKFATKGELMNEAKQVLIHEWAHYFQRQHNFKDRYGKDMWEYEGAAQAFSKKVAPKVYRKLGVAYNNPRTDTYRHYVRQVERAHGWPWIMHGQFKQAGGMVMPPYGGSFAKGGTVPGPMGAPRTVVAHGGERIGNSRPIVNVNFSGDLEFLREFIDVRIDEREDHDRQISRMRR